MICTYLICDWFSKIQTWSPYSKIVLDGRFVELLLKEKQYNDIITVLNVVFALSATQSIVVFHQTIRKIVKLRKFMYHRNHLLLQYSRKLFI